MPTPFGKYVLQRKLAEGGMAEVFLAKQAGLEGFEKLVVIKRILPQLLSEPEFVKMFLNEARLAARLNHPNVVQIFDLGMIDQLYFIAMEFVHGEDLRSLVVEANSAHIRPPPGLVCRMLADTLAGLHYAHTRASPDGKPLGLVHRDVSPQNVLVTYEGSIKLVDFGIAKATRETSEQTQAGLFKGKFSYMAPEQTRGQPIDARADVFAVGILLWELLTWRRLFKRATEMATLIAVSEDNIPLPRTLNDKVPPELERIVMRALARPLSERYATAQDMRADLEALIRAQSWEADALALERFMREAFAAKLRAQDADIRAAGLASLDDFLLNVNEGTRVSWMPEHGTGESAQRTPSAGLPTAPDQSVYDDESSTRPTEIAPPEDASSMTTENVSPPVMPQAAAPRLPAIGAAPPASPNLRPAPPLPGVVPRGSVAPRPAPPPPRGAPPAGAPPRNLTPPPVARGAPPMASPSVVPRSVTPPPMAPVRITGQQPVIQPLASISSEWSDQALPQTVAQPSPVWGGEPTLAPQNDVDNSTAKQAAYNPRGWSRWRRLAVIGSAATLVAAIGLTAALWPSSPPAPVPPSTQNDPPVQEATLEITLDLPAILTVDGNARPLGTSATVRVQAGVEHVVTYQRPGHSVHTVHVPALAANEHRPIKLAVH